MANEPEARSHFPRVTRRRLLTRAGGAVAGMLVVGGGAFGATRLSGRAKRIPRLHSATSAPAGPVRAFVSRPDLRPPTVEITGGGVAPGYLFVAPSAWGRVQAGPLMIDDQGEPVWFKPISAALWATNFRADRYRGKPVLTWWEGTMTVRGFGRGEGVIADASYREIARVRAGNSRHMDMHEFRLTPQGTALFVCYPESVPADLSPIGGPSDGNAYESIIQEVDVESGRVLLEWRSLEHLPLQDSYQPPAIPYDYLHVNSIDVTPDGNLLVSGRCTWALYKLERRTGRVIWRLGGKRSDFALDHGARFSWQHDGQQPEQSTITLFDDADAGLDSGTGFSRTESQSRGVILRVDERRKRVSLARSYRHPRPLLASAMGSMQTLPDGHVLVGWGSEPVASEFSADGRLLADMRLGPQHDSYRAFRYPWMASPTEPPAIATRRDAATGRTTLYASWNGATAVSHWLLRAGPHPSELRPVGIAKRRGFETAIPLGAISGYVQVGALDSSGRPLASSGPIQT